MPEDGADTHVPLSTLTVYVPDVETVIDCVVSPVDQTFPLNDEEIKVTLPPEQKVVELPAVIPGVLGTVFTVTVVPEDGADTHVPLSTLTV